MTLNNSIVLCRMICAKSIKYFHFGAFYTLSFLMSGTFYTWKSIIAGLSSFGESKAFIFLDAVHIRINGECNILKKKKNYKRSLFL